MKPFNKDPNVVAWSLDTSQIALLKHLQGMGSICLLSSSRLYYLGR